MQRISVLRVATCSIVIALCGACPAAEPSGTHDTTDASIPYSAHADAAMDEPVMATAMVSASGGELKTNDGSLAVQVPSGALDADLMMTAESAPAPASGAVGTVFEIGPTGTQFKQPVTIALSYGAEAPSDLRVATYADGAWQVLANYAVDADHHTISGTTMHLSPYALVRIVCAPVAAASGCAGAGCPQPSCANYNCAAYPGARLDCAEAVNGPVASCCFDPGEAVCVARSSAYACAADAGESAGGSASGGAASGAPRTDAPDASVQDAGVAPIVTSIGAPTCPKASCSGSTPCEGMSGATRSSCQDTDTGFTEVCCLAPGSDWAAANGGGSDAGVAGTRDASVGGGGSGTPAADGGVAPAPVDGGAPIGDASVSGGGSSGGMTGSGGAGAVDASTGGSTGGSTAAADASAGGGQAG